MHIVVGTPCYGGMLCTEYADSVLALKEACLLNGIKMTTIFLGNESLIQRGRNLIAHYFMSMPDADYLLFVDADQKFDPNDVAKMIKTNKALIGAPVPMKGLNWSRIRQGAIFNHPDLSMLGGIFNVNKLEGHDMINAETPFQVRHVGTGFMLIRRDVFETLQPHVGYYLINNQNKNLEDFKVSEYFTVRNKNHELLSEDYNFCEMYRELGGTVWLAPWCRIGHFGAFCFNGKYVEGD